VVAAGKGTKQLHLSDQRITPIPEGVFPTLTVLTTLNLYRCDSLATLPESLGQLRALTTLYLGNGRSLTAESPGQLRALTELYLGGCTRLSVESLNRVECLLKRNQQIRDGIHDGRALRFPMTTHDFAATALFGSMLRRPRHPSGDGADVAAGAGGTATTAAASASDGQADASLVRVLGAFPDCVLSKLNSDGPHSLR
jgi:hypothetical protein